MARPKIRRRPLELNFKRILIGLTEEKAIAKIQAAGYIARVMQRDGESFFGTADFRGDRVNLVIKDGKVTRAYIG